MVDSNSEDLEVPRFLPSPKRGALPTPKVEIERATKYIPEIGQPGDQSADEQTTPPDSIR